MFFPATTLEEGFDLSQKRSDWEIVESKGMAKAVYSVNGLKPINITINKTKHLVLNFNCDCTHFKPNRGCKHIAALLYIGQVKVVRLKPVNEQRKFGFEELIEVLNSEELSGFLKFYSSNNSVFNKLFKQYFSYKFIQYGLSFPDYLNQIVMSHMDVSGKYNSKSKKQISQIFELHLFRADQLIKNSDWAGALDIVSAILIKTYQLDFTEPAKNIEFIIEKGHTNIMAIATQPIAPLLKRKITKISLDLMAFKNYNYFNPDNAVELARINLEENFELVKNLIDEKLSLAEVPYKSQWLFQLYTFLNATKKFDLIDFYSNYLDDETNLIGLLEIIDQNHYEDKNVDRMLEIRILKMDGNESPELIQMLGAYLVSTSKDVLYSMLFEHLYNPNFDENELNSRILFSVAIENNKIAKQISMSKHFKKDKGEQFQIFSKVLYNAGKFKDLMVYLDKYGDLETLLPKMITMLDFDKELGVKLVKDKLSLYLDGHVGSQSSQMIEDIMKDLNNAKMSDEAEEIWDYVRHNYGNRKNLVKSLKSYSYL